MILHIAHSATSTLDYDLESRELEILKMTDHFTNDLYNHTDSTKVEFALSRLICDVERFEDDKQESMADFGMGVCYTTNSNGEKLRDVSCEDKEHIIQNYYRPHHQKLSDEVDSELKFTSKALIVDCHSFPDESYYFNNDYKEKRPDICIGCDEYHTPIELMQEVKKFFLLKGYVVKVNDPYSGTMVPSKHYKKDERVKSIMIEINRKLYMDEEGYKTEHYKDRKSVV